MKRGPKYLSNSLIKTYWSLPLWLLVPILEFRSSRKFIRHTKIKKISGLIELTQVKKELRNSGPQQHQIYFYHSQRISRYFIGIEERLNKLLSEYMVDQIADFDPLLVVDVGSNIGEFSMALGARFPKCKTIRFEPSITEAMASLFNLENQDSFLIPKALWSQEATLEFFMANEDGDSSIFQSQENLASILVQASTLDKELSFFDFKTIDLLKIEAEGAEPEVLLGAANSLLKTRYVAADLGPERGLEQTETFEDANRILIEKGFILIAEKALGRQCYLYENRNLKNTN
jgi:FkbM family methyltransferase